MTSARSNNSPRNNSSEDISHSEFETYASAPISWSDKNNMLKIMKAWVDGCAASNPLQSHFKKRVGNFIKNDEGSVLYTFTTLFFFIVCSSHNRGEQQGWMREFFYKAGGQIFMALAAYLEMRHSFLLPYESKFSYRSTFGEALSQMVEERIEMHMIRHVALVMLCVAHDMDELGKYKSVCIDYLRSIVKDTSNKIEVYDTKGERLLHMLYGKKYFWEDFSSQIYEICDCHLQHFPMDTVSMEKSELDDQPGWKQKQAWWLPDPPVKNVA